MGPAPSKLMKYTSALNYIEIPSESHGWSNPRVESSIKFGIEVSEQSHDKVPKHDHVKGTTGLRPYLPSQQYLQFDEESVGQCRKAFDSHERPRQDDHHNEVKSIVMSCVANRDTQETGVECCVPEKMDSDLQDFGPCNSGVESCVPERMDKYLKENGNMDVTPDEVLNLILEEEDQGITQPTPGQPPNISVVLTPITIPSARTEAAVHTTAANVRQGTGNNPRSEPSQTANQTASGSTVANSNSSQRYIKAGTSPEKRQMRRDSGATSNGPETNQSSSSTSLETESMREENKKLKELQLCKVCLDSPVTVIFLPCGHFVCCERCSKLLKHCPICRKRVKGTVKTYMS